MSSSNGRGRKRKSNFDQVPADDGFRNYMKNKIKLQRKQFGLQLPPPPQSPSSRSQSSSAASAHNATPPPTILKRSIHSSGGTVGKVEDSPAKSVRFHVDVLDDANSNRSDVSSSDPKSISDVLNSLKRQHPATKRRKRRGRKLSMSSRIQSDDQHNDAFAYNTPKKNTESPTDSELSASPALGVLDVLDNLQKKHGSSTRRRRSSSSTKRRKHSHSTSGLTQSSLEMLDELDSNATEAIERNRRTPSSGRGKTTPVSKRRRDSPRCLGASVLEGLQSSSADDVEGDSTIQSPIDASTQAQPSSMVTSPSPAKLRKQTHRPDLFFSGVVVLVNGYTNPDAETLKRLLQKHGGDLEKYETSRVTHIIAEQLSTAKANIYKRQKKPTPVCTPNWITDSIEKFKLLPHADYLLEGILDKNVFGSNKVKSYFNVQPKQTQAHAGQDQEDKRNCDKLAEEDDHEKVMETEPEKSVTGRPYRWQDKDPHEAPHMFAGAKTVGNDPK